MEKKLTEIVFGIDPGFDRFGWAVVSHQAGRHVLLDCGCIETNRKAERLARYQQIHNTLKTIFEKYQPTIAGMEQLFFSKNVSTALPVAEIRGMVIGLMLERAIQVREFNPGTVKSCITGNGRADKNAMRKMILLQLGPVSVELRERVTKELDDTIDAIGVALTALRTPSSV